MQKEKKKYLKPEVIRVPIEFKQMVRNITGRECIPFLEPCESYVSCPGYCGRVICDGIEEPAP
ncbi:MAG: hypothetical protein NC920_01920 [Candidatus Omnitrophica bacterium]|nr:hypothetical protein [Candidatus Omnitrophota bacterium]MCM8798733.1 hypothetical protein [Candidatus Omnitrophota bacterium]